MKLFKTLSTSFENFDDTVHGYLAKALGNAGEQYSKSQIFSLIYESIKGVMQNAMFYIEDAFTEQNIDTAIRTKSIYSLAKLSGYEASYGSASTGTINIKAAINNKLTESGTTKIYIKNGAVVKDATTEIAYSIYLPSDYYIIDLAKPLITHRLKVVQGIWNSATYIAKGNNLETVHITTNSQFDREYVEVYVDGVRWKEAACLYDMTENSNEYFINVGFDNTFDVTFGNNIYGKALTEAQNVVIRYVAHTGEDGNIYDTNRKFSFVSLCYDSYGNQINANNYLSISIESQISGGTAPDSIDTVRKMVGYSSRNLILASIENFKLFLKRFSFIGYNTVWSEHNSFSIVISALANYSKKIKELSDYLKLTDKDIKLTEEQKNMIVNSINNSNKLFAGIKVKFKDPIIRKYSIMCYVKLDSQYNRDSIKSGIKDSISDYFINLKDNISFIPKSDIITKVLNENKEISGFDINFISDAEETGYGIGYYYKYDITNSGEYFESKHNYESNSHIGLDDFGNILLNGSLEVPFLGRIKYYTNKETGTKDNITLEPIQIYFI